MALLLGCNPNSLAIAAACYSNQCLGPDDREAIEVHAMIQELNAIGGINYTGTGGHAQLEKDVASWMRLPEDTRRAIHLYLTVQNAINKGASFPTDINSLRAAAKCYLCDPWEIRRCMKLYLKCLLNQQLAPD